MSAKKPRQVRIEFTDEEGRAERLPASPVGANSYRLEVSPSFAYSVSHGDVVRAERGAGSRLRFAEVVRKSGNRTLRLLFSRFSVTSEAARPILEELEQLGCRHEHTQEFVLCVNVPREVELIAVVEFLKTLGIWWEHADPTAEEFYAHKAGSMRPPTRRRATR
ncbi:MAG TPA: DUF4265 domain-containing protein [Pyrinomonadaceae bacterium]|nr:DUF4265 domain-containing protein [Pyrinomonadaceae bacterium]